MVPLGLEVASETVLSKSSMSRARAAEMLSTGVEKDIATISRQQDLLEDRLCTHQDDPRDSATCNTVPYP